MTVLLLLTVYDCFEAWRRDHGIKGVGLDDIRDDGHRERRVGVRVADSRGFVFGANGRYDLMTVLEQYLENMCYRND